MVPRNNQFYQYLKSSRPVETYSRNHRCEGILCYHLVAVGTRLLQTPLWTFERSPAEPRFLLPPFLALLIECRVSILNFPSESGRSWKSLATFRIRRREL